MNKLLAVRKDFLIFIISLLMMIFSGCRSTKPEYVFFMTENRDQLEERALKYCHGDFRVLKEEEFGPYTRARLQCIQ